MDLQKKRNITIFIKIEIEILQKSSFKLVKFKNL